MNDVLVQNGVLTAGVLVAALLGTTGITIGTVLQQRAAQRVGEPDSTRTLLGRVLRQRGWWSGQAVISSGFACYAWALHIGPLALVQPVLVTGLVIGTITSARLARRRLDRRLLIASVACVLGLASFLSIARPESPAVAPPPAVGPLLVVAVLAAVAAALGLRRADWSDSLRAALLALATGGCYGVTATLVTLVLRDLGHPLALLSTWHAPAAAVSALAGWALSQRALHLGRLMAPVNAVIGTTDPTVAVLLGVLVLGEHVASTPVALFGELLAAAVVVAGTVVITRQGAAAIRDDRAGVPTVAWG